MNNPVLFLVFNRPNVAKRTFAEIAKAKPPRLYIACDGARANKEGEAELVAQVRKITELVNWQCEIKTLFQNENLGCGLAVSTAITWFFKNEEQGIILEDDCLPNESFFQFCDELLEKYKDEKKVATVSGFNCQHSKKRGNGSYYFSDMIEVWGWATWRRAWQNFKLDVNELDENVIFSIIEGKQWSKAMKNYWYNIWRLMKNKGVSSWGWPFTFHCWLENSTSIIPNVNLISNIGFGSDSTHTYNKLSPSANTPTFKIEFPLNHPEKVETNFEADEYFYKSFCCQRISLIKRIKRKFIKKM
jgi:hypothetical protein